MYGIPNMKLDKKIVKRRIDLMKAEGIEFITNTEVGKDFEASRLLKEFDAVVLCGGATKPRDLKVEGRELSGIHFAVDFLSRNTKRLLDITENGKDMNGFFDCSNDDSGFISAKDKDVVIIGGGDTGNDCVATSIRHDCRSVIQLELMPELPEKRTCDNPWPEWPKVRKVDYGHEESIVIFGKDPRRYCTSVKKFIGDANGNVKQVVTVQYEWKNENGRLMPVEIPGSEVILPAQLVILAMGFLGPEDTLIDQLGVKRDARSNVDAPYGSFKTNVKGVFAAGDMRRGQSLVVWAINEGRGAAQECHKYLMGDTKNW